MSTPSASYGLTIRCETDNEPGALGRVTTAIGEAEGLIGAIDIVKAEGSTIVRDIVVSASSEAHGAEIVEKVKQLNGVKVLEVIDRTFALHEGGKISVVSKVALKDRDDLSMVYTPGVARVCKAIEADPEKVHTLTIKKNTVAVVSDGTAVLGLGDIGPAGAMPVMEGKAMLFKEFGAVDAFPICLDTKNPDEIVAAVKALSVGFGGINLEDISAPRCFEVENRLIEELNIPVFHDDQHGTAVVATAALFNALKLVGKDITKITIVMSGAGAAGVAVTKMMMSAGARNVIVCDRKGAIYAGRTEGMNPAKDWLAANTNPDKKKGTLGQVLAGADVFVGVSSPNLITADDVKKMAKDSIVFAMANPDPEIRPEAIKGIARIIATGRSDFPNQINNVLCFPGLFRGALDCRATKINEAMKLAAAKAIAGLVADDQLSEGFIIPSVFDRRVGPAVAKAVEDAARASGVAPALS